PARGLESAGEEHPRGGTRPERQLASQALVGLDRALDDDAPRACLEEKTERQMRPLTERDDDAIGTGHLDGEIKLFGVLDHGHDGPGPPAPASDLPDDPASQRVRPKDQQALAPAPPNANTVTDTSSEHKAEDNEQARQKLVAARRHRRHERVEVQSRYSTVTLLARLRGWSTSQRRSTATW